MKSYEWAVIGGGIAGIAVSEILCREGHSVVLIEKNDKLKLHQLDDNKINQKLETGKIYDVKIEKAYEYDVLGSVLNGQTI